MDTLAATKDGVEGGELLQLLDEDVVEPLKNEVTISDGLTQCTKVVDYALYPVIVVADAEVALLEGAEPDVELWNM
jgi:hypothetical protein